MATARPFDLRRPFVANAPFSHGERRFAAGDAFPWRDLDVSPRKLLAMWGCFLVANAAAKPKRPRAGS